MLPNSPSYMQNQNGLLLTSLTIQHNGTLLASSVNEGIFRIEAGGAWVRSDRGLPKGTDVYRLESAGNNVYACTNKGLYRLQDDRWELTVVTGTCSRLIQKEGILMAAADSGLWVKDKYGWLNMDYTDQPVYDVLATSTLIYMAQPFGLTILDRYTQAMDEIRLGTGVNSLAVLQGALVGATTGGDLLVGNKRGGFELARFGRIKLFSVAEAAGRVYACTNRGLYRILNWNGRCHLCSVKLGFPVTDLVHDEKKLYLATYFEGIQNLPLQRRSRSR